MVKTSTIEGISSGRKGGTYSHQEKYTYWKEVESLSVDEEELLYQEFKERDERWGIRRRYLKIYGFAEGDPYEVEGDLYQDFRAVPEEDREFIKEILQEEVRDSKLENLRWEL